MNPLILFVHPKWRRKGIHSPLLNSWWGNPFEETALFSKEMFDAYSFDTSYYSITDDVEKAHMVFVPYRHNWLLNFDRDLLQETIDFAKTHNLPLLIDGSADIEFPIKEKNVYILRYGGYRFLTEPGNKNGNESRRIQIPLTTDDLLERTRNGKLEIRKKGEGKPMIGFAGWTKISPKQRLRTSIKEIPITLRSILDPKFKVFHKGILWRQKIIKILQKSPQVTLNLLERSSFSANPKTAEGDMKKLREEMVTTILESDYALDVKGDANNSARLFEILSLGRIPIIIDTERNFPFKDKIDYSSFALIVDFRDIHKLPEIVAEFHKNISPLRFEEMQRNARNAFVTYFRIDAMMKHIHEALRKMI